MHWAARTAVYLAERKVGTMAVTMVELMVVLSVVYLVEKTAVCLAERMADTKVAVMVAMKVDLLAVH